MNKSDTDCIKYVLDEMDPAERVEYERKVKESNDLLIEVESLRCVQKKIQDLPLLSPPENLTNSVLQKAEKNYVGNHYIGSATLAIAAVVLVIGLAGSTLLMPDSLAPFGNSLESQASISAGQLIETERTAENRVSPWVDKNQNIYFMGRAANTEATSFESELQKSYSKLRAVNRSDNSQYIQNHLQLTGSGN